MSYSPAVAEALSSVGTVCALFLFLAPARTIIDCVRKGTTDEYSPLPYISAAAQCWCWVLYCVATPDRLIPLACNVLGFGIELVYTGVFLTYAPPAGKLAVNRWAAVLAAEVLATSLLAFVVGAALATQVIGVLAVVLNMAMFASPCASLVAAIKAQSVEFLPLLPTIANFLCPAIWTAYAVYVSDSYIFVPNVTGVVFGFVALLVYARYCDAGKKALGLKTVDSEHNLAPYARVGDEEAESDR